MENLKKWLQANQLDKYSEILLQNDITSVELLFELTEDDFKELTEKYKNIIKDGD